MKQVLTHWHTLTSVGRLIIWL